MIGWKNVLAQLLIFICSKDLNAQMNIDSLRKANLDIKLPIEGLLGNWISNDSLKSKVEFSIDGSYVIVLVASFTKDFKEIIAM